MRDVLARAEEALPMEPAPEVDLDPIPEDVDELIVWLRKRFPEVSPRTSDPRVIDACIARSAVIDLFDYVEGQLKVLRSKE